VAVSAAQGHVLFNGLGLGMVLQACMEKEKVEKATVIELSQDVIDLVAPHYKAMYGDRVDIIKADAMAWSPPKGTRYGMVWHDIWTYICGDNYEQMKTLHRRYGSRSDWQGSWCRYEAKKAY
jgi:spermidine synthase